MAPSRPELNPSISNSTRIDVGQLLGACVDAVKRACAVIREVEESRKAGGSLGETYKDASDPRSALTIADVSAQSAIVGPLSRQFPELTIIAEEDHDMASAPQPAFVSHLDITCDGIETPERLKSVSVQDLCLFCDPLDGTLEFVQGRLDAVQSLLGITMNGTPIAGVIGQPFVSDEPIYGLVGAGVVNLSPTHESRTAGSGIILVSSATSKPVINKVIAAISPGRILPLGGAGNKMLQVAKGRADLAILNLATSLWDSAATTAIVTAVGGFVTDLFGNPIQHYANSRIQNRYGVIASNNRLSQRDPEGRTHKSICQQLRVSMILDPLLHDTGLLSTQNPQASDIALDLDGNPITVSWLSIVLNERVAAFSADDSTAVRYLMSEACRLKLHYDNAGTRSPRSVFMKRIVMKHLEHVKLKARTTPRKLERDVTSYQVEAAFLSSDACKRLCDSGTRVARSYYIDSRPAQQGDSPIESKFLLLLEDFSPEDGWGQVGLLDSHRIRSTLDSLASLHAFFWRHGLDSSYDKVGEAVWDQGTYWVPHRQAADSFQRLASCWDNHLSSFAESLRQYGLDPEEDEAVKNLGHLLAKHASSCADKVHSVGLSLDHPHRTIIHGDAKAANFFYRCKEPKCAETQTGGTSTRCAWDVGIIDFQWCGWGHPAVDVGYLIAASAAPELLTHDGEGEQDLLFHYYSSLTHCLVKFGKASDLEMARSLMSFAELKHYYDEALLDISRVVISYHWDRISASPKVLESRKHNLGSNAYNKNIECAMWLVSRTVSLLLKKEAPLKSG